MHTVSHQNKHTLTDEQIESFVGLYKILRNIHLRLVAEGKIKQNSTLKK